MFCARLAARCLVADIVFQFVPNMVTEGDHLHLADDIPKVAHCGIGFELIIRELDYAVACLVPISCAIVAGEPFPLWNYEQATDGLTSGILVSWSIEHNSHAG